MSLLLEIVVAQEAGRACAVCGERIHHAGRGRPPATCSDACREKRKQEQCRYIPSGVSRSEGVKAWHAKRGTARLEKRCLVCAKQYQPKRPGTTCCSRECGFEYQATWRGYRCDHPPAPAECIQCGDMHIRGGQWCGDECRAITRAIDAIEDEADANELRTLHLECTECGVAFSLCKTTQGRPPAQCSSTCIDQAKRDQGTRGKYLRKMRMDSREREVFSRREIYERDMWFCMLCGGRTDPTKSVPHPLAPTLDHTIPIAKGGCHTRRNVQTAHFICNSLKSDSL